jgi:hypothetical protein
MGPRHQGDCVLAVMLDELSALRYTGGEKMNRSCFQVFSKD